MLGKISGINGVLVSAVLLHALAMPTPAQFVPGHIFSSFRSSQCNVGTDYVMEINPETGESFFFASVPVCGGLKGMAMSPDGKRLRVTSYNSGTVFEFDSQGNWTVVPGVSAPAGWNNIAYDQQGNFYASNPFSDAKVVRIPPEGGPPEVLAYADNNGVALDWPGAIAAGPSGEVYVADDDRLIRIGPDGGVTLFDQYPMYSFIYAVLVDDFGLYTRKSAGCIGTLLEILPLASSCGPAARQQPPRFARLIR